MSLRKQLTMMMMSAAVMAAQQQAPPKQCEPPPGSVRKVIQVQNQPAYKVAQLARGLGLCAAHDDAKQVAVSGPASAIQALEDGLKKTDTGPKVRDVEFIGYILLASNESSGSEPTPAALDPVIQQLRSVFPYKSYQLLDTLMARQSGSSYRTMEIQSSLPMLRADNEGSSKGARCDLQFQIGPPSEGGGRISFEQLRLFIREADGNTVSIQTSTSIRDGQKVVIGKANGARPNQTFFLVASARLVD